MTRQTIPPSPSQAGMQGANPGLSLEHPHPVSHGTP